MAIIHRKSQPNLYKLDMKETSLIIPLYFWLFTETEYKHLVTFPFFFSLNSGDWIFKNNFIFLFFSSQFFFLANLTSREKKRLICTHSCRMSHYFQWSSFFELCENEFGTVKMPKILVIKRKKLFFIGQS